LAVFSLVSFFFMPVILAQKESRLLPPSGWGGFKFIPCAFAEARPLAFKPPLGFLPSLRVHAGDLAICYFKFKPCMLFKERLQSVLFKVTGEFLAADMRQADSWV